MYCKNMYNISCYQISFFYLTLLDMWVKSSHTSLQRRSNAEHEARFLKTRQVQDWGSIDPVWPLGRHVKRCGV